MFENPYQSSTKGYVAVYLIDDSKNAYCLLPYQSSQDGKVRVDANTRYPLSFFHFLIGLLYGIPTVFDA